MVGLTRAQLIERGLIHPLGTYEPPPAVWFDSPPTLRIDAEGRRLAASRVAQGGIDHEFDRPGR